MTTEAQLNANRENAQKSTGPRTAGGKARSSLNAITHGLSTATPVIPGEDPVEYQALLQQWNDSYGRDVAGQALAERAATAQWKLRRCDRAEAEIVARRVRESVDLFDRYQLDHADHVGRRLFSDHSEDPPPRIDRPFHDMAPETSNDPPILRRALLATSAGREWLLGQLETLKLSLKQQDYLRGTELLKLLRLLGKRAEDGPADPTQRRLVFAFHRLHPDTKAAQDFLSQQGLNIVFGCSVTPRVDVVPDNSPGLEKAEARETIHAVIDAEVALVHAEHERLQADHEATREGVRIAAAHDPTPEMASLNRYQQATERLFLRCIDRLLERPATFQPHSPAKPEQPLQPAPIPAPDTPVPQNEPNPTDADAPVQSIQPSRPAHPDTLTGPRRNPATPRHNPHDLPRRRIRRQERLQ